MKDSRQKPQQASRQNSIANSRRRFGRSSLRLIARGVALAIAVGVGSYIVFCRGAANQKQPVADSPNAPAIQQAQTSTEQAPESCEGLAIEIRQFDIFMTTSKSGPSPADMDRLDAMRARYERHCKR